MSYDRKKAAAKAKRTRAKNLRERKKHDENYRKALSRARTAENKLKAFKEGFEEALKYLGGKI